MKKSEISATGARECKGCLRYLEAICFYNSPRPLMKCKLCLRQTPAAIRSRNRANHRYATDPEYRARKCAAARTYNDLFREQHKAERKAQRIASIYGTQINIVEAFDRDARRYRDEG